MTIGDAMRWGRPALALGLAAVVALGTSACGAASDSSVGGESMPRGWEAEAWLDALEEAEEQRTGVQAAFYSAAAVHDASMMGAGLYAHGRSDVVGMQMDSSMADLIRGPLFLDVGGVVRVFTMDYPDEFVLMPPGGPFTSLTHVQVGEDGIDRLTHMRGSWYRERTTWWETPGAARKAGWLADEVATAYWQAWSTGDADAIYRLYTPEASVTDSIRSVTAEGQEAIIALAAESATPLVAPTLAETVPADVMDTDPYPDPSTPAVYYSMAAGMESGVLSEVWVPVRSEDDCPGEWVAALTVDGDGRVITEQRFPALDSLRACNEPADLAEGWWTGRDLPFPFGEPVTTSLDTGAGTIEVRNGSPATNTLVTWAMARFAAADLPAPAVSSITFNPYAERCRSTAGYADWTSGQTSILICFDGAGIGPLHQDPDAVSDAATGGDEDATALTPVPRRGHLMLHELSHSWLVDHTDDATRQAFLAHIGLDSWNDRGLRWAQRGIEWAAETLTWGLKGTGDIPDILDTLSCQAMADGFRTLTGTDPLTTCGTSPTEQ